jgi:hypothetical protein
MTRQLTSAVRHKLLRSPHAKRPAHGRLRSSRLVFTNEFASVSGRAPRSRSYRSALTLTKSNSSLLSHPLLFPRMPRRRCPEGGGRVPNIARRLAARPREPVKVGTLAVASEVPITGSKPLEQVQTGGFGDPNGLPADSSNKHANVSDFGSPVLPPGPGYGNGAGGVTGTRGPCGEHRLW